MKSFHISTETLQRLNLLALNLNFQQEMLADRATKMNAELAAKLKALHKEYAESRYIADARFNFNIDKIKKASTYIYKSDIFGPKESRFFEAIRYLKENPSEFAFILVDQFGSSTEQYFIDFIISSFYTEYSNSACPCERQSNLYVFIRSVVQFEFERLKGEGMIDFGLPITHRILNSLLKREGASRFFMKFVKKLDRKIFSGMASTDDVSSTFDQSHVYRPRLSSIDFDSKEKGQAMKYEEIVEDVKAIRESATSLTRPSMSSEEKIEGMSLQDFRPSLLEFRQKDPYLKDQKEPINRNSIEYIYNSLIKCVDKFMPIEIKMLFYFLQTASAPGCQIKADLIRHFLFDKIIQQSLNSKHLIEYLKIKRITDFENLYRNLGLLTNYMFYLEQDDTSSYAMYGSLAQKITGVSSSLMDKVMKKQPLEDLSVAVKRINKKRSGDSILSIDSEFTKLSKEDVKSNTSNQQPSAKCNSHSEALCLSFKELAMLIEVYSRSSKCPDATLVTVLAKVLSSKAIANTTGSPLEHNDMYFSFIEKVKIDVVRRSDKAAYFLDNILQLKLLDNFTIKKYEGSTLFDLLILYKPLMRSGSRGVRLSNMYEEVICDFRLKHIRILDNPGEDKSKDSIGIFHMNSQIAHIENKYKEQNEKLNEQIQILANKDKEIQLIGEEIQKLKDASKKIIKERLLKYFERMVKEVPLDACISVSKGATKNLVNDTRKEYKFKLLCSCKAKELTIDPYGNLDFYSEQPPEKIHIKTFMQLLTYLKKYKFSFHYIADDKYSSFLNHLINGVKSILKEYIPQIIDEKLINIYSLYANSDDSLDNLFEDFFTSKVKYYLFSQGINTKDDAFQLHCEVLNFIRLKDLITLKNVDMVEANLTEPAKKLRSCSKYSSVTSIIREVKESMKAIVNIVSSINNSVPGNEVMHPTFVYCILNSRPAGLITTHKFASLCLPDSLRNSEGGFVLAQLEVAIAIIKNLDKKNLQIDNFERFVLENELKIRIHMIRRRENTTRVYKNVRNMDLTFL